MLVMSLNALPETLTNPNFCFMSQRPALDDSHPWQPLPPPLLVLLAPATLHAPLCALAPVDHPHFSPPAPIKVTGAPPPFVVAARMLPHP